MNDITKRKLSASLATVIEKWLEDLPPELSNRLPYQPADLPELMADQAITVLAILDAGEQGLRDGGMITDEA